MIEYLTSIKAKTCPKAVCGVVCGQVQGTNPVPAHAINPRDTGGDPAL